VIILTPLQKDNLFRLASPAEYLSFYLSKNIFYATIGLYVVKGCCDGHGYNFKVGFES